MTSLIGKLLNARSSPTSTAPVPYSGTRVNSLSSMYGASDPETFMRAYGQNGTIFSMVRLLCQSTAKPQWHLYRKQPQDGRRRYTTADQGSDQRTEVVQHQALNVLNSPASIRFKNLDIPVYTRFTLLETSQMFLELTGESWLVVQRDPRASFPTGLWPVRPDRMTPVPSKDNYLLGYVYTGPSGEQIPLQLDEVILTKYPNPLDPYRGLGPVQTILTDVDAAKYSATWNRNFFLNSAIPGGVIQADHRLDDDEWTEFTNRWREGHRGVGAAHRVAVLEAGMTWVPNAHTVRDMDFANLRNVARDVMREAFAMHKTMLGVADDVNRANAETAEEVFESWQVTPRLDRWAETFNAQFLPLFGSAGEGVEFDYEDPVSTNREADALELTAKAKAAQALVAAGYDPSDVLETVGLPDMGVAEKATQLPAVPPAWVPVPPPGPDEPAPAESPSGGGADGGQKKSEDLEALMAQRMAAWNSVNA